MPVVDRESGTSSVHRSALLWPLLAGMVPIGLFAWLYWPLMQLLHETWMSRTYSHGYLVLGLAVYLGVHRWRWLGPPRMRPALSGLVLLAGCMAAFSLMELLFLNGPRLYVLPLLMLGAVLGVLGWRAALLLAPPILYLYSALPLWDYLTVPLQTITTAVVSKMLVITGVPAHIEGNFVSVPAGNFEIATGCSGLHAFIVSIALTGFLAIRDLNRIVPMVLFVAVGCVVAMLSNWIRVYGIILAGHLTDMQHYLVTTDHYVFGWVVFVICIVPLLMFFQRLPVPGRSGPYGQPGRGPASPQSLISGSVGAAILVSLPALLVPEAGTVPDPAPAITQQTPASEAMAGPDGSSSWKPRYIGAEILRETHRLRGHEHEMELFLARFHRQRWGARLVRWDNSMAGPNHTVLRRGQARIAGPGGASTANELILAGPDTERRIVWYWYEIGGRIALSSVEAKLMEARALLDGRRDAAALAVSTVCRDENCQRARNLMRDAMQSNELTDALSAIREDS